MTIPVIILEITVVIFSGICVSIYVRWYQRKLAAKRATLDFISKYEVHDRIGWRSTKNSGHCRAAIAIASARSGKSLVNPTEEEQNENDPQKKEKFRAEREQNVTLIFMILNHFELVSLAIYQGIIAKKFYKKWYCGIYIRFWDDIKLFVDELRKQENEDFFIQFEELAEEWKTEEAKKKAKEAKKQKTKELAKERKKKKAQRITAFKNRLRAAAAAARLCRRRPPPL